MSAIDAGIVPQPKPESVSPSFYSGKQSLRGWLFTRDHKRIAILYTLSITLFFFLGGAAAAMIRYDLIVPSGELPTEVYNKAFTFHGVVMVWFFLLPSIPVTLGNFLLPIMIGAKDLAFPRINLFSWYLFVGGGAFVVAALWAGGVDTGWTFYTPYSTMFSNTNVYLAIIGVFVTGFSTIFTGLNFIVTTHTMRMPGMTWMRLPLFVWGLYAVSLVMVLATPVLAMTLALVGLERVVGVGVFDPALGGDPLLFQHLFWFYSHPAVYMMILPAMGLASEIISCFTSRRVFGYKFMTYSMLAIAVIGFMVWGHHMFVSGMSVYAAMVFSLLSFLVAVPSAIKIFNWTATLRKGDIRFTAPMLYALGFVGLFLLGGLTGLILAAPALDEFLHDTYFVIAHFHYVMVGGSVMCYLGGIHFWWPKVTGKLYSERLAKFSAVLMFVGFNVTFFPQYLLGYRGMPRRYHSYLPQFQELNVISTGGAVLLAISYTLPVLYLLWSLKYGKKAPPNPWDARGLEWQTSSPPPKENFLHPPVPREAYAYDKPAL
ncbi:MAG TPA: cbb3-type cytochrome c oxidase subunit I [Rhodanobacteraceae bacterium]|nr:cbb3-type cytochrome c oxidase subunit I [Rhodanobacteraceae bacterium]